MKLISILFTGGTIGMRKEGVGGSAVPAVDGLELLARLSGVPAGGTLPWRLRAVEAGRRPSPHMSGAVVRQLRATVDHELDKADAVVVAHGSDTLEETAFLLDLWHQADAPVVLTAAMRTSDEPGWDGDANLLDACRVAADPAAAGRGVLVVMNRRIHAATEVTKAATDSPDPLVSRPAGILGRVESGHPRWYRRPLVRRSLSWPTADGGRTAAALPWVELVSAHQDSDGRVVEAARGAGCAGFVVRAMGRGNMPPDLARALTAAVADGRPVVLVSRCPEGEPGPDYGYPGGGALLRNAGVVFCRWLNDLKARIALTWLLQAGANGDEVAAFFESSEPGSVSSAGDPDP